jgi:hypothetical protein
MQAAAGQPAEIEFGKSDFILITQVSDTPGSISLKYSAVPVKADIAGQWNFESMYYIDVEARTNSGPLFTIYSDTRRKAIWRR